VIDQIKTAAADFALKTGFKPKIACLGLAFKPDIDDLRESPAAHIAQVLLSQGYDLVAVEPNMQDDNRFKLIDLDGALKSADVVAILVRHKQFISAAKAGQFARAGVVDFCGLPI
jgi:UDP-N-acetyl-D-mannosaminuronic acid dehydrogenase